VQPLYQPAEQRPPQPRETMPRGGFKLSDSEVPSSHSGSRGPPGPCICESAHPRERPNGETRTEPPQKARTVHWTRALLASNEATSLSHGVIAVHTSWGWACRAHAPRPGVFSAVPRPTAACSSFLQLKASVAPHSLPLPVSIQCELRRCPDSPSEGPGWSVVGGETYNPSDLKHDLHCGFVELGDSVSVSHS
jgi:hypothetical protein